jgi:hypothetical protein
MLKKCSYLILALLIFSATFAFGQKAELTQKGTSMANFLKIGVGARASAMGGAYVALSNDVSSLYWNPGGLGMLEKNEALFQITNWIMDTKLYFVGISYKLGSLGILGFHFNSFSSGDIEETTILEPDGTKRTFTASNFAAGLTFSRQLTNRFSAGITLKYISESLDRENAETVAIDVGSVFITNFFNNLRIGFAFCNLGGRMQLQGTDLNFQHLAEPGNKYTRAELGTEPWDIPLLFRFGVATDVIRRDFITLTMSTEVMDSRDFTYRITSGGELAIKNILFLRGGYKFNYDEADLTFGAGFKLSGPSGMGIKLDYAYGNYGVLNNTEKLSIIFMF